MCPKEAGIENYGSEVTSRFPSQTRARFQKQEKFRNLMDDPDYLHAILVVRYAS